MATDRIPPIRPLWVAVGLAAVLALPQAATRPPERQQELRVLLCARTMAEGGSWVVPEFQGQPRLRKPPLMYWVTALPTRAWDSLFMSRLPGTLAGIALVAGTWCLGCRTLGPGPAAVGAVALATSRIWYKLAPTAETDTVLSLCVLGGVSAAWRAREAPLAAGLLGACMGLGFLTKGPAAVVLPLVAVGWALIVPGTTSPRMPQGGRVAVALGLAAVIAVPWYAWIRWMVPGSGDLIAQELSDTFGAPTHPGPPWYWLYTLPKAMLPWGVWLPVAAWRAVRARQQGSTGSLFLWGWLAGGTILLTLTPQKQEHYAMLVTPVAALVVGADLLRTRLGQALAGKGAVIPARTLAVVGALVLVLGGSGVAWSPEHRQFREVQALAPAVRDARFVHVVGRNSAWFEYGLHRRVENLDDPVAGWRRAASGEWLVWAVAPGRGLDSTQVPAAAERQGTAWAAWEKH